MVADHDLVQKHVEVPLIFIVKIDKWIGDVYLVLYMVFWVSIAGLWADELAADLGKSEDLVGDLVLGQTLDAFALFAAICLDLYVLEVLRLILTLHYELVYIWTKETLGGSSVGSSICSKLIDVSQDGVEL